MAFARLSYIMLLFLLLVVKLVSKAAQMQVLQHIQSCAGCNIRVAALMECFRAEHMEYLHMARLFSLVMLMSTDGFIIRIS